MGWIIGCLEFVNYSIIINAKPRGKFRATKGLSQGDPLSSFLFTFVCDVLSKFLEKAQELNLIHGFVYGQECVKVSTFSLQTTLFFSWMTRSLG